MSGFTRYSTTSATLVMVASILFVSGCGDRSHPTVRGGGDRAASAADKKSVAEECAGSFNDDLGSEDRLRPTAIRQAWNDLFLRGVGPADKAEMIVDGNDCIAHIHVGGGAVGAVDQYFVGTPGGDWAFRAHLAPAIGDGATATALSLDDGGFIELVGDAGPVSLPASQAPDTSTGQRADETYGEWCRRDPASCREGEDGSVGPAPTDGEGFANDFGFRAPSRNIYCNDIDGELACSVMSLANEHGQKIWFLPRDGKSRTERVLANIGIDVPDLPYGEDWSHDGITCNSTTSGITCTNTSGDGFALSREAQVLLPRQ